MTDIATIVIVICSWMGIIIFCFALELETRKNLAISWAVGAVGALISAGCYVELIWQIVIFVFISLLATIIIKFSHQQV